MAKVGEIFSFELKQFRLAYGLNRSEAARLLGVGPTTLTRWEDGKTVPQTATIWRVINAIENQDLRNALDPKAIVQLTSVFSDLARSLNLPQVQSREQRALKLERDLSGTILRAAQTDFRYADSAKAIEPIPFSEDLALFRNQSLDDIRNLLDSLSRSAIEIIPDIEAANINSRYLSRYLRSYSEECRAATPNPRFLQSRGEIIRNALNSQDIVSALNIWDTNSLANFVDTHNELMRRYFGEALVAAREVDTASADEGILAKAPDLIASAIRDLNGHNKRAGVGEGKIDTRIIGILWDVEAEIKDTLELSDKTNDPQQVSAIRRRALLSVKHSGIFIGRLLYRILGFAITNGGNLFGLAQIAEIARPGSIRAVYDVFVAFIPALPKLPF
ncbi:MAG: helix-turn-helix domain-containing protein [Rhodobacteraceae bacterium]|nr:helix-turn-helix domain-containing protein [Paracoccaceae bacterium]